MDLPDLLSSAAPGLGGVLGILARRFIGWPNRSRAARIAASVGAAYLAVIAVVIVIVGWWMQ